MDESISSDEGHSSLEIEEHSLPTDVGNELLSHLHQQQSIEEIEVVELQQHDDLDEDIETGDDEIATENNNNCHRSIESMHMSNDNVITPQPSRSRAVAVHNSMPDLSFDGRRHATANNGRITPIKPMTMREYDQTMQKLKNENWDLKLKLFTIEGGGRTRMIAAARGDQAGNHPVVVVSQKVVQDVACQMSYRDSIDVGCQFDDDDDKVVCDFGSQKDDHDVRQLLERIDSLENELMVMQRDINIRDKMIQGLCAIKGKHRNKSADEVSLSNYQMTEQIELWQNEQDRSNNIEQLSRYFSDEKKTDKVANIVNYLELNEQTDCGERVNQLLSTQLDAMVSHFVGDRSLQARLLELDDDTTRRSLSSPAAISKLRRAVQRYTQLLEERNLTTNEPINDEEKTILWHEAMFEVDTREIGTNTAQTWTDIECLKKERDELTELVHQLDAHIDELEAILKKSKSNVGTMTTDERSVSNRTAAVNTSTIWTDIEQLQNERDNLKRVVYQLEARVKQMERLYVKEMSETATMTIKVRSREVDTITNGVWSDVDSLRHERDNLKELVEQLNSRIQHNEQKKEQKESATMTELNGSKIDRLKKNSRDVSDIVRQLQINNDKLEAEQTESDRKIRKANELLSEYQQRYAKLLKDRNEAYDYVDKLRSRLNGDISPLTSGASSGDDRYKSSLPEADM